MHTRDFYYELPDELIAQRPLPERAASRLLVLDNAGQLHDSSFDQLPSWLRPGDLLVFNDTRVLAARLFGQKETGGQIEALIERVLSETRALAHIRASKSPKPGSYIMLAEQKVVVIERQEGLFLLELEQGSWSALMETAGHIPLPPYIQRQDEDLDHHRFQTVYARQPGAVAAPTAGLHFDEAMLDKLDKAGIESAHVTLHVGAGTFQPVRVDRIEDHVMHSERVVVSQAVCEKIAACKARGGRVVAVGTTSVRSLESAAQDGTLRSLNAETDLFITPGYQFKVIDAMLTNYHLPESTLLMLVAAFAGYESIMKAYQHAVEKRYRFFSYGDAMLIEKPVA